MNGDPKALALEAFGKLHLLKIKIEREEHEVHLS